MSEPSETLPPSDSLVQYLAERDVPCPACRYNLRGLKINTCPECGTVFELGLRGYMPGFRAWMLAVILTCVGIGFATLTTFGGTIELLMWGFLEPVDYALLGSFLLLEITGIAHIAVLIRRRTSLWQRSERQVMRHVIVGSCLVVIPIGLIVLMIV